MKTEDAYYFTITPSFVDVSPSPLPWFVYSNLLQSVSRSFINRLHLTWWGYLMCVVRADILLATRCESRLKFDVPPSHLLYELKQYTKHLSWKPYLVQANKFTRQKRVNNLVPGVYCVIWNLVQLFSDNNTLVLRTRVLLSPKSSLDSIYHTWNSVFNPSISTMPHNRVS